MPTRVLLIDDHRRIHEAVEIALQSAADIEMVGHGGNGQEALQLCDDLLPDLILMDVMMPEMDGVQATQLIRQKHPHIKILVLSSFQDDETIRAMLEGGADGYILKGSLAHDLAPTIRATVAGSMVLSKEVAQNLLKTADPVPMNRFEMTDRELEVLRHMAAGLSNSEIGAKLSISQSTVKFHLANILEKMNVDTRAEVIVLAAKNNLI